MSISHDLGEVAFGLVEDLDGEEEEQAGGDDGRRAAGGLKCS